MKTKPSQETLQQGLLTIEAWITQKTPILDDHFWEAMVIKDDNQRFH